MKEAVETVVLDNGLQISKSHPSRAVAQTLFGYALYKHPTGAGHAEGLHAGLTDQEGAYQWLAGTPRDQIRGWTVEGVTASDSDLSEPPLALPEKP